MNHQILEWKTKDNLTVFGQLWMPEDACKAVILLVHGMGEHSSRYAPFAEFMTQEGIAVFSFDHRGHGKSGGKRGHSPNYECLMDDLELALMQTKAFFEDLPLFMMGHSLGGNLVLNYVLRRKPEVQGVIASAPWIRLAFSPSRLDLFLAKTVVKIFPSFTQSTKLEVAAISRIPEEVEKYKNDPLVHDKISPAMFMACYPAGLYLLEHAAEWALPLYIYHGSADRLTSFGSSKEFANKLTGDIRWQEWQNGYHELHNDVDRLKVLQSVANWVKERL